ncbi:hypothetical protein FRC08_003722, partial [Ceratobasidium sp. 394]
LLSKDGCARSTEWIHRGIRVVSGALSNGVPGVAFWTLPLHGCVVEDGEGAKTAWKIAWQCLSEGGVLGTMWQLVESLSMCGRKMQQGD